jgi:copper chaperone CopZ
MERLTLDISGMTCSHCAAHVTRALEGVPGVRIEKVAIGSATVSYEPASASPAQIAAAVTESGYDARPGGQAART